MFHVLASHVSLGHLSMSDFECENKDRCIITNGRQPLAPPSLYQTKISYCNFKSNPVKSNKKYSVYIKPMSIGTLVQDQRSVTKTVKVKKQHGHRSEIQQYISHTWALTSNWTSESQNLNSSNNRSNKDQKIPDSVNSLYLCLKTENASCLIIDFKIKKSCPNMLHIVFLVALTEKKAERRPPES